MSPPSSGAVDDVRAQAHTSHTAMADVSPSRGELGTTRRKRLRELLFSTEDGLPLESIERLLEAKRSTIIADLEHLRLSFKHQAATLLMVPPSCTTCGFTFRLDVPKAPSRCPQCKSKALSDPIFKAAMAEG
jgi:predicted Zn-ribbon and HTH transcriptional regulator